MKTWTETQTRITDNKVTNMDKIQIDTDTSHVENIQIGRLHAVRESTVVALIYIFRDDNTCVLLSD